METIENLKFFPTEPSNFGTHSDLSMKNDDVRKVKNPRSSRRPIRSSKKAKKEFEFDYNTRAPLSSRREKRSFPSFANQNQFRQDNLYSPRGRTVIDRNSLLASIKVPLERKKLPTKQDIKQYKKEVKGLTKPNRQYEDTSNENLSRFERIGTFDECEHLMEND